LQKNFAKPLSKKFYAVDKSFQKRKLTNVFINLFFQKTFFMFVDFFVEFVSEFFLQNFVHAFCQNYFFPKVCVQIFSNTFVNICQQLSSSTQIFAKVLHEHFVPAFCQNYFFPKVFCTNFCQ
jgi:hypothetical protein